MKDQKITVISKYLKWHEQSSGRISLKGMDHILGDDTEKWVKKTNSANLVQEG